MSGSILLQAAEWLVLGVYGMAITFIFCYSLAQLHLVALYLRRKKTNKKNDIPPPSLKDEEWPFVTVQLPLFNEKYVVSRLIDSIMFMDYPEGRLEVQVLDDSTDETTDVVNKKIHEWAQKSRVALQLIRRPDRAGYKAGALKYGLDKAKGTYIAVFDADFLPGADFLRKTVPFLVKQPSLGVVQTRWKHLNQTYSLLTRLQAFGLDAHFSIEQVGRNSQGHFINFNGTGGVWRKACIYDAGNWSADTLTEDLDLSYRAQLKGWEFMYREDIGAPAELPATMNALKSQQFRWTKGAAESAVKNLGKVLTGDVPSGTKFHAFFHLLNSSTFLCLLVTALLSVPVLWIKHLNPDTNVFFNVTSVFIVSFFCLTLFYAVAFFRFHRFSIPNSFQFLLMYPVFLAFVLGLSLHNGLAVMEGFMGKKSPFIRTPKFNIQQSSDQWKANMYRIKEVNPLTWLEAVLAAYFIVGLGMGFYLEDYGFFVFHTLLIIGFSANAFYTVRHAVAQQ